MHLVEHVGRVVFRLDLLQSAQVVSVDVVNDRVAGWSCQYHRILLQGISNSRSA